MKEKTKTFATMTKHPSGLTWERWHWFFKTPQERIQIQQWMQKRTGNEFEDDPTNPF